jgi:hypothetical protein
MAMPSMDNGNIDRLYRQLERIESKIDKSIDDHDSRISILEFHKAEQSGANRMLMMISGGIGAVMSLVVTYFSSFWTRGY